VTVLVLGAGLAGLSAASRLREAGVDCLVVDERDGWGGHASTSDREGFLFDEGPHVSFTSDPTVIALFDQGATDVLTLEPRIANYVSGRWVDHPVQSHLHGLDRETAAECLIGIVEAGSAPDTEMRTYRDWLLASFGQPFTDLFPARYTRKYWTVEPSELTLDWIENRVHRTSVEDAIRGALIGGYRRDHHYIQQFRYPASGGFQSFARALVPPEGLLLGRAVVEVDVRARAVTLDDGKRIFYDELVSTVPLDRLVAMTVPSSLCPRAVKEAADRLSCTSVLLIDIALDRPDVTPYSWFYVYDEDIPAARVSAPHLLAHGNAPEGKGSLQLEIYYSPAKPLPASPDSLVQASLDQLEGMGLIDVSSDVRWARSRDVGYANVVFDHRRASALSTIREWAAEREIALAGRYGLWEYLWSDGAVRSGYAAAEEILALPERRRSLSRGRARGTG